MKAYPHESMTKPHQKTTYGYFSYYQNQNCFKYDNEIEIEIFTLQSASTGLKFHIAA